MKARRPRTPDERAASHRKRRAKIADRGARERECAERARPLGLEIAPPPPPRRAPPAATPAVEAALAAFRALAERVRD